MENLIDKINEILDKIRGWIKSTLEKLSDYLIKRQQEKREKEIAKLVVKLWRLNAIWKIPVRDLKYVEERIKEDGREFIWEVDYKHKYLFRKDRL